MRRFSLLLASFLVLVSRSVGAQTEYSPSYRLVEGRELAVIYFGSTDCGPCQWPQVKSAIRAMKPLLAAQAKQRREAFTAIGSAQDWDLKQGAAFLEPLGAGRGTAFEYHGPFAIETTLVADGRPRSGTIEALVSYGLCRDVCIPGRLTLTYAVR